MLLRKSGLQGHCPQNCIYLAVHCRLSAVKKSAQGLFRWIAEVELNFQTTYTKSCRCTSVDVSSAVVAGATAVQLGSSASGLAVPHLKAGPDNQNKQRNQNHQR